MVAVFCFNGCREFAFFVYAKELPAEDCPTLTFFPLRGSILRLRRAPSLRGYPLRDYLSFAPLRGSILRLWHGPSPRGYPLRTISLSLSHRCEDPSSSFGTALLQGPTHFGLSLFRFRTASRIHPPPSARPFSKRLPTSGLSLFRFRTASWIHSPPSARPFSKGLLALDYLSFAFTPLRGSILRLRRAPSLRGYPLWTISLSLSYRYVDPSSAFGAPLL